MPTNAPYCASKAVCESYPHDSVEWLFLKLIEVDSDPGAIYTPIDRDVESDAH